jgi:hypothetical protein
MTPVMAGMTPPGRLFILRGNEYYLWSTITLQILTSLCVNISPPPGGESPRKLHSPPILPPLLLRMHHLKLLLLPLLAAFPARSLPTISGITLIFL